MRDIILGATKYSAVDVFNAEYQLQDLRSKVRTRSSKSIDALLLPTAPTIYRIEEIRHNPIQLNSRLGIYTNFVNLLDLCAIAVPAGLRDDGLPFGVTFMAPAFSDAKLLRLAALVGGISVRQLLAAGKLHPTRGRGSAPRGAASEPSTHQPRRIAVANHHHRAKVPPFRSEQTPRRQNRACSA